ncbi:uncharacterized protein LY89DRAFT_590729 [Mollisia scopiformis]|uniref:Carbohydrate esterase family 16 protein n=1 Tax=Mollisia scopiformis TaxID=149040 RepID=A0A194X1G2_MOLSC|nr:uncharacterized protein LY89DRAFT_590729 [Mollisia scopiformis]KUJ14036.1 hypothetical protein LY89DRAFT_590729 [Mollisia scopiformis]
MDTEDRNVDSPFLDNGVITHSSKELNFLSRHRWSSKILILLSILAISFLGVNLSQTTVFGNCPHSRSNPGYCSASPYWKGWPYIKYTFAFGDSWTSTSFNYTDAQPSPNEPLGNPPFPGITSSNATNWIGYLTTKYNASFLQTFNLAVSGTTLNNHITNAFPIPVTEQIYARWMPAYAEAYWTPWKRNDTLFMMFVGINDVIIMNDKTGDDLALIDKKLESMHLKLLSSLYGAGARNFLLLNVPPLERIWQPPWVSKEAIEKYGSDAKMYNRRINRVAASLKAEFADANVFVYDVHRLFNEALDEPKRFEQLRGIKNTTEFCPSYAMGTPTTDYFLPECGIPVNEYFWLNALHPTYPIHDVLAEEVVKLMESGPNVC